MDDSSSSTVRRSGGVSRDLGFRPASSVSELAVEGLAGNVAGGDRFGSAASTSMEVGSEVSLISGLQVGGPVIASSRVAFPVLPGPARLAERPAANPFGSASAGLQIGVPGMSFVNAVRNVKKGDISADVTTEEDMFSDADASYVPGRCGLNLKFSERVHEALDRNWCFAVIVNLMGKLNSVNLFEFVLRGLRRKWPSSGCWKLIDLPNDYFVVNFDLEEDMEKALCDGPWVLGGHTLVVRRWCATFNPLTDVVRSMAVWARVEGLPIRFFTDFAMSKIGKLIGEEVVKVDNVTIQRERGRYGRVCVEIDLNKPFKSMIEVEDVLYKVRYEGLDHLCFNCGVYGHAKDKCPATKIPMEVASEGGGGSSGHACVEKERSKEVEMNVDPKEVVDDGYGPWMLMDYKNKKKNGKVSESKPISSKGSRFSVLDVEGDVRTPKTISYAPATMATTTTPSAAPAKSKPMIDPKAPKIIQMWQCTEAKLKEVAALKEVMGPGTSMMDEMIQEEVELAADVERKEGSSDKSRVSLHALSSASASKAKKGTLKVTKRSSLSKAQWRNAHSTPYPSSKPLAANPDSTTVTFPGVFGRSPPEEESMIDAAPNIELGVKGIVAHFEVCADGAKELGSVGGCSSVVEDASDDQ